MDNSKLMLTNNEPQKSHYTALELAGLPGIPSTERGVRKYAEREAWPSRPRAGRGGGREYPITALPKVTRDHLLDQYISCHPATVCALPAVRPETPLAVVEQKQLPDLGSLKGWQTKTMDARLVFINLIERAIVEGYSVDGAIKRLVEKAQNGQLEGLQPFVAIANKRSGTDTKKRTLSERSLYRWRSDYKNAGGDYRVLAPKDCCKSELPDWAPAFLAAYRVGQKISPRQALETMQKNSPEMALPSIDQVRRFIKGYSRLDIQRGRKTGAELRAQRSYIERDTSKFNPGEIVLCDGHSFKAKVAHPAHGRPFNPEVCAVVDAVTRLVWGWSAGLAESTYVVADAIRDTVTVREGKPACIPALLYTDNGAGNTAAVNSDELVGLFSRLGITFKTGRPGNPQGRGRVERLQASLWIRAAKELPTFTGKAMDAHEKRKVYLTLDKEVRAAKKSGGRVNSELLISWADFLQYCDQVVAEYNRRPHSALPRFRDPQTGLMRHQSPLEALAGFAAEGWQPVLPEADELAGLFRPQVQVKANRSRVIVHGNWYQHPDLEHYHGDLVSVAFDIHDANQVWVRDWEQRLICIAKFENNKRDFFPIPVVEQAKDQRHKRRKSTAMRRIEEIDLEKQTTIELVTVRDLPPEVIDFEKRQLEKKEQTEKALAGRRMFRNGHEVADWLQECQANGETLGNYESRWLDDYLASKSTPGARRIGLYKEDPECAGRFAQTTAIAL